MIKKLALSIVLIALLSFTGFNNFRKLVLEKLEARTNDYPEKVYVQTDKPFYATDDDIWYTAYLVNGITHKRSDKSRVIYVELINDKDSILIKKQLYTNDVSVAGDFKLKKGMVPGNYMLRAYTNYMRNENPDYFFQKQIPIWNINKNDSLGISQKNSSITPAKKIKTTSLPEINFYPEGGYLINGIASKVGIKVIDKHKKNILVQGYIKDSNNHIVSKFKTLKFGLGVITLLPEANKTYHASIIINNEEVKYPLPKALPNGYNLNVANHGNEIVLKVSSNNTIGLKNSFLIAHQRGRLIFERLETKNTNSSLIRLKTTTLTDGVANFTLFDSNGKPVCERLVYIDNPDNGVVANVSIDNKTPKTRDKISILLDLRDKSGNNVSGNLSMSITDIGAIGQNTENKNIKTYFLLNSDLRGHIDNPNYFFEKENDIKRRYLLDLLMMTHGWRRFTWNGILYGTKKTKTFSPEKGIFITGHTTALKGDKQQIPTATRLTFMSTTYQEKKQTNKNGIFKYGPYVFNDTLSTIIEARVKDFKSDDERKNRFVSIHLDDNFYESPKVTRNTFFKPTSIDTIKIASFIEQAQRISEINTEFIESRRILDEVVITAQKKSEAEKRRETLNARTDYGFPSNRIDMKDFENVEFLTVLDLLNTLPGVNAFNNSISIRNQGTPSIFLDGFRVQLEDILYLRGIDVEFIDVLKGANAAFYSNSANGVIAIYSRTGANFRSRNIKRKPGIIDFTAIGFYTAREFYAPDHINSSGEALKQDIRTTLHWEPKIMLTDDANKAEISFFTSDSKSNYAIKIEGITNTGDPVYHLSTFQVD
ncbi:TonB-dependent receptor plug domain-containing protein [Flavivirga algicola]|uniref:TonB-dependent receptor plug domain-containing protein n=1 Tax=Flavivirga algicola TaxID=2729136 RepID=A0ABX1S2Z5_9FLAO|nr:TonB-dependent receptor plug domain-containing protein [Flavivirga algicola]NMH89751.1 TonB-dependent receptor plug domain-containing protein [Flavivirga algicola]